MMRLGLTALALTALCAQAADFYTGQAAWAVIGQSSFSSTDASISPVALSQGPGRLFVADAGKHLLTFDTSQLSQSRITGSNSACSVCIPTPVASITQPLLAGIATFSSNRNTVVAVSQQNHTLSIWRDVTQQRATKGPDLVLGKGNDALSAGEPISVAYDGKRLFVGDASLRRVLVWNSLPTSESQAPDAILGQTGLSAVTLNATPDATTIGRPSALFSDGTNLFVGDSLEQRVLVFAPADLNLMDSGVVNSASMRADPVAPGTLVTITGSFPLDEQTASDDGTSALPKQLGGAEVLVDGHPIPLLSTSTAEIRAQIPYVLASPATSSLFVRVQRDNGTVVSSPVNLKLVPASPGLFAFGGKEPRTGILLHGAGESGIQTPVTQETPAQRGEVITVWASGLGQLDTDEPVSAGVPMAAPGANVLTPLAAYIGGAPAQIVSAILPEGAVGVYEIRVQIPRYVTRDSAVTLAVAQNGVFSNTVKVPLANSVQ